MMFHEITMKPMNLPWHFRCFSRRPTPPLSRLSTCPAGENHHFGGPARRRRAAAGPFSVEDSRFFVGIDMLFNGFFMGCNVFFFGWDYNPPDTGNEWDFQDAKMELLV